MIILQTMPSAMWAQPMIKDLHLTPTAGSNGEPIFLELIRSAVGWDANVRLHLQEHPMSWFFIDDEEEELEDDEKEGSRGYLDDEDGTVGGGSIDLTEALLQAFSQLFESMRERNRKLHIALEKRFVHNMMSLRQLFQMAIEKNILEKVETNHPEVLNLLAPLPSNLKAIALQIYPEELEQVESLHRVLSNTTCSIEELHLYVSPSSLKRPPNETCIPAKNRLMRALDSNASIETFQWSGTISNWFSTISSALVGHPKLRHLWVEHLTEDLVLDDSADSFAAALSILLSSPGCQISHLQIQVQNIVSKNLSLLRGVSDSLRDCTIQAGLDASSVDSLLVNLSEFAPNLQYLDLEGNDIESISFPKFMQYSPRSRNFRLVHLERLYLGFNPVRQRDFVNELQELLKICPKLDIGNRGMSCGIAPMAFQQSHSSAPSIFTTWASGSPEILAWKDWNTNGRSLLLQHTRDCAGPAVPDALWPLVFDRISRRFHRPQHRAREATVLFQFLQAGALTMFRI